MPRPKRISDTELLEKALLVVGELGPETFTLADVGKAVGLAPATLVQRYGSKRGLLVAALKHGNEQIADLDTQGPKDPRQALVELLSQLPPNWGTREDLANSLRLLRLDLTDPDLRPLVSRRFALRRRRIAELVKRLSPTADHEAVAWELDALTHGLIIQWGLSGSGSLQQWLRQGLERLTRQIAGENS